MDVHRLMDVWQVVLQEPRVAAKEATLLLQYELSQDVARQVLEQQNELKKKTVVKSDSSDKGDRIKNRKRRSGKTGRKAGSGVSGSRKKKKNETRPSIMGSDHVDIVI